MWKREYLTDQTARLESSFIMDDWYLGAWELNKAVRLPNFCLTHNLHNFSTQTDILLRKNCTSYQALGGILFIHVFWISIEKYLILSFIFFRPIIIINSFKRSPLVIFFFCFLATKAARQEKWFSLYKNKQDDHCVAPQKKGDCHDSLDVGNKRWKFGLKRDSVMVSCGCFSYLKSPKCV